MFNPLHDCLIVEVDGQAIGYTWLVWWSEHDVELFLHLGGLVPQWRRKGIGHALLRWQERGIQQADIGTRAENPGKSLHLYESVGYQVVLRQPRYRKPF